MLPARLFYSLSKNVHLALQTAQRGYLIETGEIIAADTAPRLLSSDLVRKAYLGVEG